MQTIWSRCAIAICDPRVSHLASLLQDYVYTICKPYSLDLLSPSVVHVSAILHHYCKTICTPICEPCVKQFFTKFGAFVDLLKYFPEVQVLYIYLINIHCGS